MWWCFFSYAVANVGQTGSTPVVRIVDNFDTCSEIRFPMVVIAYFIQYNYSSILNKMEETIMAEKIHDIISATKGYIGEVLVEEAAPALVGEMVRGTVVEAAIGGAVGAISPRIGGIMVAYQQKRWERNWEKYIYDICQRQEKFNERLNKLENAEKEKFKSEIFPLVSDFVQNTKQEEKISFIVNGLMNLAENYSGKDDIVLMYYETLDQLSLVDIRMLKLYSFSYVDEEKNDDIYRLMREHEIDDSQASLIREKLERLGLLQNRNEEYMNENLSNITSYIEDLSKGKKNPKLKTLKKITRGERYKITPYGNRFLKFFLGV